MRIFIILIAIVIILIFLQYFYMSTNIVSWDKAPKLDYLPKQYVIPYFVIKPNEKDYLNLNQLNQLDYPVYAKPDECSGQGKYVEKLYNKEQLLQYLNKHKNRTIIIQQFDDSPYEFSILYERLPIYTKGRVVAVVEKVLRSNSSVVSNVKTSDLINRPELITKELNDVVDKISKQIPNFYAGRYDVKVRSIDNLKKGQFKIIELNGVSGMDHRANADRDNLIKKYYYHGTHYLRRVLIGLMNNFNINNIPNIYSNIPRFINYNKRCYELNSLY